MRNIAASDLVLVLTLSNVSHSKHRISEDQSLSGDLGKFFEERLEGKIIFVRNFGKAISTCANILLFVQA